MPEDPTGVTVATPPVVGPALGTRSVSRTVFGVVGFVFLAAVGAQLKVPVPWTDVPMTLQPVAVLVAGLCLSPAAAMASMGLYAGAGAAGLPVFTPQSVGLMGPTGGYIVGFIAAAGAVSLLRGGSGSGFLRLATACLCGMGIVLAFGVAWRAIFFGGNWGWAITSGFLPFAAKAVVESLLAAAIGLRLRGFGWRRGQRLRQ